LCLLILLLFKAEERVSFEDKELATVANIPQLDLVALKALAQTVSLICHEFDFALEDTFQVED